MLAYGVFEPGSIVSVSILEEGRDRSGRRREGEEGRGADDGALIAFPSDRSTKPVRAATLRWLRGGRPQRQPL